jgi:hypothetical protein
MNKVFSILLMAFTFAGFSQVQKGLTSSEFEQLKKDYAEMTRSETYRDMIASSKLVARKTNGAMPTTVKTEDDFYKWISENISKTAFSSVDEAKSMFKDTKVLVEKNREEFKEVWTQLLKASQPQVLELVRAEIKDEVRN